MHARSTFCILSTALLATLSAQTASASAQRQSDFNGDGYTDLVMPASGEKIGTAKYAGAINVVYGSSAGLASANNQYWHQDSVGIADDAQTDDSFGSTLAWGDFNNDGYSDLAVGAVGENNYAGAVHVLYGSASGLTSAGSQFWQQGVNGISGFPSAGEDFGYALAVGDFDGDSYDDLAISAPDQSVNGDNYAGEVHIIYGSGSGLTGAGSQSWSQDSAGIDSAAAEYGDFFGGSLAAGDFNGDGRDDLAIGAPWENFSVLNCGALNVLFGSVDGITADGNQFISQDSGSLADAEEEDDFFAWALAAGDFDNDGKDDLAISTENEKVGSSNGAGCVHVMYGSGSGLRTAGTQFWTQESNGIGESAEANDYMGTALACGDFNNDGYLDLAIGVMGESIGSVNRAGAVNVIYGSAAGLDKAGNQVWSQDSKGIADSAEGQDGFGSLLLIGDYNGDGRDDLAVGTPHEKVGTFENAGAMNVIYGAGAKGLKAAGNQLWTQDSTGIADKCEKNDYMGFGSY